MREDTTMFVPELVTIRFVQASECLETGPWPKHRRGVRVWQEVCLDLTQTGVALEGACKHRPPSFYSLSLMIFVCTKILNASLRLVLRRVSHRW